MNGKTELLYIGVLIQKRIKKVNLYGDLSRKLGRFSEKKTEIEI